MASKSDHLLIVVSILEGKQHPSFFVNFVDIEN